MRYLSECLLIKNENQYLLEHLKNNVQAGIEHFFIYDNNSSQSVEKFLADYPELQKICTIEIFPDTENKQIDCYKHFVDTHRKDSVYCAFVDTDEMFEGNLQDFLQQSNETVYEFKGVVHGCNNQALYEDKPLKDRFFDHIITRWSYGKNIVKLSELVTQLPHRSICKSDNVLNCYVTDSLHHYYYKSFEEFIWKIRRGTIQKNTVRRLQNFFQDNSLPESKVREVLDKYGINLNFHTEK